MTRCCKVVVRGLTVLSSALLTLALAPSCQRPATTIPAASSPCVEFVEVSRLADRAIAMPIIGPDGTNWFYNPVAVLTLKECKTEAATVGRDADGRTYFVGLLTTTDASNRLSRWSDDHLGQTLGVIVDGKLKYVDVVRTRLSGGVIIPGFATVDEAQALRDRIRSMPED